MLPLRKRLYLRQVRVWVLFFTIYVPVVCNENQGGSGRWHTFGKGIDTWRSMFFCLIILLSSFNFSVFPFSPSKSQFLGNDPNEQTKRGKLSFPRRDKKAEESKMGIPVLYQYIDATMHLAPIGNAVRICWFYNFQILFRGFFFCSPLIAY